MSKYELVEEVCWKVSPSSRPRVARVRILGVGLLGSVALLRDQVSTSQVLWLACRVDEILTKLEEDDTSAHTSLPQAQWADLSGDNACFSRRGIDAVTKRVEDTESRLLDAFCLPARICLTSRITSMRDPHSKTTCLRFAWKNDRQRSKVQRAILLYEL